MTRSCRSSSCNLRTCADDVWAARLTLDMYKPSSRADDKNADAVGADLP
jgi:hypothetical protein